MADEAADAGAMPVDQAAAPDEIVYLDMATREIVREFGNIVGRYTVGDTEFDLYAEMNTFEKRNEQKPSA